MYSINFSKTGGPEVLKYEKLSISEPKENEVLIKHSAIGLNFIDTYHRSGLYPVPLPSGIGLEGAGIIEKVGPGVKNFKEGDFVEGRTGWQDNPTVHENKLRLIDPSMAPLSTAIGVLGMPGTTAYVGMKNFAKPQSGETLVVSAASGAVGGTVGQIGKIRRVKTAVLVKNKAVESPEGIVSEPISEEDKEKIEYCFSKY